MKRAMVGCAAIALWLATPAAARAHEGHAGDHGWLAGALQPLLSLDHFLAGAFVVLVLSAGLWAVARRRRAVRGE